MSSLFIVGFFAVAKGNRAPPIDGKPSYYAHYTTSLQCIQQPSLPADLHVYTHPHDGLLPDNTIVYVIAKMFVTSMAYLDAIVIQRVPGDPSDVDYEEHLPDCANPYVFGLGHVSSAANVLDDGFKSFGVNIGEYVRSQTRISNVICAYEPSKPRWKNTPAPSLQSSVNVFGVCHSVVKSHLRINLEHIALNAGSHSASRQSNDTLASPPSVKKRKFNAIAPQSDPLIPIIPTLANVLPTITPPPLSNIPQSLDDEATVVSLNREPVQTPSIKAPVFNSSNDNDSTPPDSRLAIPTIKIKNPRSSSKPTKMPRSPPKARSSRKKDAPSIIVPEPSTSTSNTLTDDDINQE